MFVLGANAQAGWLYVIGASFIGVLAAGLVMPPIALKGVTASRRAPAVVPAGDAVSVQLSLTNHSRGRRGPLAATDMLLEPRTVLVERLGAGEVAAVRLSKTASRRGAYPGGQVRLETAAPFGIGRASRTFEVASSVIVHPRWVRMTTFPVLESASTPNEAVHERRRGEAGTEFYGLRQYRPGDSLRKVHWRSSARGAGLLVREHEEQIGSRVGIVVDGAVLGAGADTTFEWALSCAASVVMYALDAGHPVQLFCDARGGISELFEPTKAETLDWMARLEPSGGGRLAGLTEYASDQILRRSTNVVVFATEGVAAAHVQESVARLQDAGTRVIAIALSARSFDGGGGALDRQAEKDLLSRLIAMRTIVYSVERQKELSECLHAPLIA